MTTSARILFVGVPIRLNRIMRTVIDFDNDGVLVCDGRSVHISFRIPIEAARRQNDASLGVFVLPFQADHELIGSMAVRSWNSRALGEANKRDGCAGLFVAPQHLLRDAFQ